MDTDDADAQNMGPASPDSEEFEDQQSPSSQDSFPAADYFAPASPKEPHGTLNEDSLPQFQGEPGLEDGEAEGNFWDQEAGYNENNGEDPASPDEGSSFDGSPAVESGSYYESSPAVVDDAPKEPENASLVRSMEPESGCGEPDLSENKIDDTGSQEPGTQSDLSHEGTSHSSAAECSLDRTDDKPDNLNNGNAKEANISQTETGEADSLRTDLESDSANVEPGDDNFSEQQDWESSKAVQSLGDALVSQNKDACLDTSVNDSKGSGSHDSDKTTGDAEVHKDGLEATGEKDAQEVIEPQGGDELNHLETQEAVANVESGDHEAKRPRAKVTSSLSRGSLHEDHEPELDYDEEELVEDEGSHKKQGTFDHKPDDQGDGVADSSKELEEGEEEDDGEIGEQSNSEDDGEVDDDDDCEEGEIKEPDGKKPFVRPMCRFYTRGHCTWGSSCRFLHPGVNDKGNYSLIERPLPPGHPGLMGPRGITTRGRHGHWTDHGPAAEVELPPPPEEPPTESAWERGLRHAKELMKRANKRKEQETNFEEKRMNLSLEDDRDFNKENDRGKVLKDPYYDNMFDDEEDLHSKPPPEHWGTSGGHYENFEVRWTREPDYPPPYRVPVSQPPPPPPPERDRLRERLHRERRFPSPPERSSSRYERKQEKYERPPREPREPREPRNVRDMREERHEERPREIPPPRIHADQWTDPWRRSKSPKRRRDSSSRSRSRGRRRYRRSYSRGSSYSSYSSRSSRSRSSSYSSYSSRSSYSGSSSYSSRSSSRSRSRSPPRRKKQPGPPVPPVMENKKKPQPAPVPKLGSGEVPKSTVMVKGSHRSPEKKRPPPPGSAPLGPAPPARIPPRVPGPIKNRPVHERGRKKERIPPPRSKRRSPSLTSSGSSQSRSRSSSSSRSRSVSVSSRTSVSSSSSSSSSGSADSENLYRDIADPVGAGKSQSPSPKKKKVPTATLR